MTKPNFADHCLELAARATDGPWSVNESIDNTIWNDKTQIFPSVITVTSCFSVIRAQYEYVPHLKQDAQFIAQSRTLLPECARRLKKACDFLRYVDGNITATQLADELEASWEDVK